MYVIPFLKYSVSKNGVTLKMRVGVVQDHWKWRSSTDHMTFYWAAIGSIVVCCTIFKLFDVNNHNLAKVTEGHFNWYHSKAWVWFPIRLP